ncbi:hypothetical protein Tco_0119911 [Tanacetum coccineum]
MLKPCPWLNQCHHTIHPNQPEGSQVNRPDERQEGEGNLGNTSSNPHPQPDPLASIATEQVFSIWKAFGGNTRDLGSFRRNGRDYGPTPTSLKIMFSAAGDDVTSSTRHRYNPLHDGITTFHDGVSSHDPSQDLEYSLSRRCHD